MRKILENIPGLIVLAIISFAIVEVLKINILPNKYLYLFIIGEICLFLIGTILYNLKNKILIIIGILLYIISIAGNIFGYYYLNKTNNFIETSLTKEYYVVTNKYYVITSRNNIVNKLDDVEPSSTITYYKYSNSIDKALKILGNYKYQETDTVVNTMINIANDNTYFLISKANYDYFLSSTNIEIINKDNYKIIYEFNIEEKIPVNKEVNDSYNIYVAGLDFTGIMRDYNLIVTVNTKTKKIVLTSIPRDFYIDVDGYNMKDTLMCLGSLDSEVSKKSLENLFNTKIDYTVNLNTTSLVRIVDFVGGVNFCSDYNFVTTHALVIDTYNDKTGKKLHVSKGCKDYNGIEILTIARERNAFPGRDRYRQKNCRQILINIIKKLATTTTLTNYNELLSLIDGLYTTDMNDRIIKNLIKELIANNNFEIIEQSVEGPEGIGIGHLGTTDTWIMNPDMNSVNAASQKINEVLNEK